MVYLLFAFLFLFSCAQKKLVPLPNGVEVDEKSYTAVYTDSGLRIVVKANAWDGYLSIEDRLIPIYVEVENNSGEPIVIEKDMVSLIDDRGNQYNLLEPKEASEIARGDSSLGFALGFGYGTPNVGVGWLLGTPYYTDTEEVIQKAFIPGRVLPGAKLRGFLYFQKLPEDVRSVRLRIGYKIGEQEKVAEFKFRVENGKESSDNGNKESRKGDRQEPY